jgi:hypothetical protein
MRWSVQQSLSWMQLGLSVSLFKVGWVRVLTSCMSGGWVADEGRRRRQEEEVELLRFCSQKGFFSLVEYLRQCRSNERFVSQSRFLLRCFVVAITWTQAISLVFSLSYVWHPRGNVFLIIDQKPSWPECLCAMFYKWDGFGCCVKWWLSLRCLNFHCTGLLQLDEIVTDWRKRMHKGWIFPFSPIPKCLEIADCIEEGDHPRCFNQVNYLRHFCVECNVWTHLEWFLVHGVMWSGVTWVPGKQCFLLPGKYSQSWH